MQIVQNNILLSKFHFETFTDSQVDIVDEVYTLRIGEISFVEEEI